MKPKVHFRMFFGIIGNFRKPRARPSRPRAKSKARSATFSYVPVRVEAKRGLIGGQLEAKYPNPFNPTTRITYALVEAQPVRLEVYSITGARVATLVDGMRPAGVHAVEFDASGLSSGVYLYRISTPAFSRTRSMVMLK